MTDVAHTTRFLLSERTNRHSSVRANGVRFWGYPSRQGGTGSIRAIGVHTTEGGRALNTARWQAHDAAAPSSYHVIAEAEGLVRTLDDVAVAFGIAGFNTPTLQLSFAGRAADWGNNPARDRRALAHAARQAAAWCAAYDIPVRWITRAQADAGARGFVRHSTMDPGRRSDPGDGFPATTFFDLIRQHLEPADPLEELMDSLTARQREVLETLAGMTPTQADEVAAFAREITVRKTAGASIVRQVIEYTRDGNKDLLDDIKSHLKAKGSSAQGLVRGSVNLFRAAHDDYDVDTS